MPLPAIPLAIPVLEAAAQALLVALGATAVVGTGAVITEEVRKRAQTASDSKDTPLADAATTSVTRTACQKCPPDCGALVYVNHHMNENSRDYQARITGFEPGTEWKWLGEDFDGFKSGRCQLQEAKGNYDQFLEKNGEVKWFFRGFIKMKEQAERQSEAVNAHPPATLAWYFQTPKAHDLMFDLLVKKGIIVFYQP